jgi:hypothetical protein
MSGPVKNLKDTCFSLGLVYAFAECLSSQLEELDFSGDPFLKFNKNPWK